VLFRSIGASLRHIGNLLALRFLGTVFPWGTLAINIAGSFAMGLFIEFLVRRLGTSNEMRLFIATGVLGGFTTFSAFSLDFVVLWERGSSLPAVAYATTSVVGAILALFLGMWLARSLC
jgi:CrcB protein